MSGVFFTRIGNQFIPSNDAALNALRTVKQGEEIEVKIEKAPNARARRYLFALACIVCENTDKWKSPYLFIKALEKALGYYETVIGIDGTEIIVPMSISDKAKNGAAFNEFLDKALDMIVTEVFPGMGRKDLANEVLDRMGEGRVV